MKLNRLVNCINICIWLCNTINRELLPTSGIRAWLPACHKSCLLPVFPFLEFCLPVHCQTAPSVCQSSRMHCLRYNSFMIEFVCCYFVEETLILSHCKFMLCDVIYATICGISSILLLRVGDCMLKTMFYAE